MLTSLVQKYALEHMLLEWHRRHLRLMVQPELMLIVGTIKTHLDLPRVLLVGLRIVHGTIAARLVSLPPLLAFRKGDLVFLGIGFGGGAERGVEFDFVVLLEVGAVRVCDGDVVEKFSTAEDEPLAPCCCLPENL
jgi:hypothetical protein